MEIINFILLLILLCGLSDTYNKIHDNDDPICVKREMTGCETNNTVDTEGE